MKFNTHESDLYILPEGEIEKELICEYLRLKGFSWQSCISDVSGQEWKGKFFLDVFCGKELKEGLEVFVKNMKKIINIERG